MCHKTGLHAGLYIHTYVNMYVCTKKISIINYTLKVSFLNSISRISCVLIIISTKLVFSENHLNLE